MTRPVLDAAVAVGETLARGARLVRTIDGLRAEQHVEVEWLGRALDGELQITVHGCEPWELVDRIAAYPDANVHKDADEIVRWVEVELDGIPCTFFRR